MNQNFAGADVDVARSGKGIVYHAGDILMSNIRPYLKKTWFADKDGVCSTDVLVFRSSGIKPEFLYQVISSNRFVAYVMSGAKGSKMPRGDKEHIMNFSFMLPSLPEQEKIALLLSRVDARITEQEALIADLEKRKKGLMQRIFSQELRFRADDGSGFPEWEYPRFGDTVLIERGGSPRPISQYLTDAKNGLNWVKIGDAPTHGNVITATSEKIIPEGLRKTRAVKPGDLILSNSMSFGRPYIMGINGCIHDGWLLIRDNRGLYDIQYLRIMLGSQWMLTQYAKAAAGSTVQNLNKDLVANTVAIRPHKNEQRKIAFLFEVIDAQLENEHAHLDNWNALKAGLLQQMFV